LEFLPRDQVEPGQPGLQHGLEVLLQLLAALAQAGRHQAAEAAREFVDVVEVDHGMAPRAVPPASPGHRAGYRRRRPRRTVGKIRHARPGTLPESRLRSRDAVAA